jgi:hypothetical protein
MEIFQKKKKNPKFYFTDYLRSMTYWIVDFFFQVSFGIHGIFSKLEKYPSLHKEKLLLELQRTFCEATAI